MTIKKISRKNLIKKGALPAIPMLLDLIQETKGNINDVPEIRVWCHPHKVGKTGSDYYMVFESLREAVQFCTSSSGAKEGAEEVPLIAWRGFEINIWDMPEVIK